MKRLFSTLILLLSLSSAFAQHDDLSPKFYYGISGGLDISQMHVTNDDVKPYVDKTRPGFHIGPTIIYTMPKIGLGFDASVFFNMRSVRSKDSKVDTSMKTYSLQIPVNLRYGFNLGDMVNAFVFLGPQFGFSLDTDDRYLASGVGRTTGHDLERRWSSSKNLLSYNIGVGGIVLEKIQVRISYNVVMHNSGEFLQVDMTDQSSTSIARGKLHACQVSLSYLF